MDGWMLYYVQANIHSVVSGHQVASSFKSNHSCYSESVEPVCLNSDDITKAVRHSLSDFIKKTNPKTKQKQAALIFNVELEELQQSPTAN